MKVFIPMFFLLMSCATTKQYPKHWWKPVAKKDLQWWEIDPQAAKKGEVILSKRNELGILSNFSHAPFKLDGKTYPNIEALWQSMKYPKSKNDIRFKHKKWPHTRIQVEKMSGFEAKTAGDYGTKVMKELQIDWVTYKGERMIYRTSQKGTHYQIIRRAMIEKLKQNPKVKKVLLSTGDLSLRPDHHTKANDPPAWKYFQIWMEIRNDLQQKRTPSSSQASEAAASRRM